MSKPEKKPASRVRPRHVRVEQQEFVPGQTKTQQHFREEVDINNIVARFQRTGMLSGASSTPLQYGDVSSMDFMAMQNLVVKMKGRFMGLPSKTRNLFNNDPAQMLAFIEDPENADQARKLGLLPPKPKAAPEPPPEPPKAPESPRGAST